MDHRLRRYYEALVRCDRREDHVLSERETRGVHSLMAIFSLIILLLVVAMVLCSHVLTASAHDAMRPDLNPWFDGLASGKGPCCSKADGQVVLDADWESDRGHFRVRLGGKWIDVSEDAVIHGPNLDGQTIVWPMINDGETSVRCFIPGSMS